MEAEILSGIQKNPGLPSKFLQQGVLHSKRHKHTNINLTYLSYILLIIILEITENNLE